jgi:hypothetical protein
MNYATSRKVAGSIPDDDTEYFISHNPSSSTMDVEVDPASNGNDCQESSGVKGRLAAA